MNALLKNIPLILLAAFGTASCGFLDVLLEPVIHVPTTPADRPFPKNAPYKRFAPAYAQYCLSGDYTGEKIGKSTGGKFWRDFRSLSKIGRPNPGGKGKIYELYLIDEVDTPPPQIADAYAKIPGGSEEWGYSFTLYTTDEDTVTDCKVTKRLLRRW
jgi:hypothetical protein